MGTNGTIIGVHHICTVRTNQVLRVCDEVCMRFAESSISEILNKTVVKRGPLIVLSAAEPIHCTCWTDGSEYHHTRERDYTIHRGAGRYPRYGAQDWLDMFCGVSGGVVMSLRPYGLSISRPYDLRTPWTSDLIVPAFSTPRPHPVWTQICQSFNRHITCGRKPPPRRLLKLTTN